MTNEIATQFLAQNIKSNTLEFAIRFQQAIQRPHRLSLHQPDHRHDGRRPLILESITFRAARAGTRRESFPRGARGLRPGRRRATRRLHAGNDRSDLPVPLWRARPQILFRMRGTTRLATSRPSMRMRLLLGVVARPIDALRITGDFEFGYNDFAYTRIDPRQVQSYKIQANYKPRPWANLDGAVEIHENRDNVSTVNNLEHDRSYSFAALLMANQRLSVDFGYNYWDVYTQALVCFAFSDVFREPDAPTDESSPCRRFRPEYRSCRRVRRARLPGHLRPSERFPLTAARIISLHAGVMWKPIKRVTAMVGYGGSFVRGNTIFLNPLTPSGTLDFNYQRPYASILINVYRGFSYKMAWNYYGYNETGIKNPFGLATIPVAGF